MQALIDRIRSEGRNLGNGILKVNSFVNHQLDPSLTMEMGHEFAQRFEASGVHGITKIITMETSGIAPALTTGIVLDVPVVFARKTRPITLDGRLYYREAKSRTKGNVVELSVSAEYLGEEDRIILIDDFLARGSQSAVICEIVKESGATLCGIGFVIEKSFEGGRELLERFDVPIVSLAVIESMEGDSIVVRQP